MKHMDLLLFSMSAFLCAIALILSRHIAVKENATKWLWRKDETAISCSKNDLAEPGTSGNKNNGGGCAHQLGASGLLTINTEKRPPAGRAGNKTHSC